MPATVSEFPYKYSGGFCLTGEISFLFYFYFLDYLLFPMFLSSRPFRLVDSSRWCFCCKSRRCGRRGLGRTNHRRRISLIIRDVDDTVRYRQQSRRRQRNNTIIIIVDRYSETLTDDHDLLRFYRTTRMREKNK